jgi:hypothetical protein
VFWILRIRWFGVRVFQRIFTTFGEDNQKQLYVAAGNTIYKIKTNNLAVSDINQANILITPNPAKRKFIFKM